jgi:excisionase family DNA binding protein
MSGHEKTWYSVKEAAEYLGISEPTIFRWMKDGSLSYYKVGNSTRFTREGLDAVVEKQTGRKEAEVARRRCACCGHHQLVEGRLQGTGRLYFHPDRSRFWVWRESLVATEARVCAACGYVQIHADPQALGELLPGPAAEESGPPAPPGEGPESPGEENHDRPAG